MQTMLQSILENGSAVASLVSAVIAAAVSVVLLGLNQFFSRRQQRIQFLQPKLEELYLMMNEVAERNIKLFKLLVASVHGDISAKKQLDNMDELAAYGHLTAKKMVMIVRLYFPKLSKIHQLLFAAEHDLNQLVWELSSGESPAFDDLVEASGKIGYMLRLMEKEMVDNQRILLGSSIFPMRYRAVSKKEILHVPPPPEGPPMSKMKT